MHAPHQGWLSLTLTTRPPDARAFQRFCDGMTGTATPGMRLDTAQVWPGVAGLHRGGPTDAANDALALLDGADEIART